MMKRIFLLLVLAVVLVASIFAEAKTKKQPRLTAAEHETIGFFFATMEVGTMAGGYYCALYGKKSIECETANEIQRHLDADLRDQQRRNEWRREEWEMTR